MRRIITLIVLLMAFSIISLAQPKATAAATTDVKKTTEPKVDPPKAPKVLSPEQIARLKQAQDIREKAQLRLAVVRTELAQVEAEIAALVRLFALEQKIDIDQYDIDLSQISQGVVGFMPKPPAKEPEKKPEKVAEKKE